MILLLAGIVGIKKAACALDMSTGRRNIAIALVCLAPIINIAVLAYFIFQTNQALTTADGAFSSRARVGRIRNSSARFQRNGGWPSEVRQLTEWDYSAENSTDTAERLSVDRAASQLNAALPFIKPTDISIPNGEAFQQDRIATQNLAADDHEQAVVETLVAGLCVSYRVDFVAGSQPVKRGEMEGANLSVAALHRLTIDNLAALAFDASDGVHRHSLGQTFGLVLDGRSEAALLLLDDLWDSEVAVLTPNGAVVAIPAHDICAFCDAECITGVSELQDLIDKVRDSGGPLLCGALLIRENGRWQPFRQLGKD